MPYRHYAYGINTRASLAVTAVVHVCYRGCPNSLIVLSGAIDRNALVAVAADMPIDALVTFIWQDFQLPIS